MLSNNECISQLKPRPPRHGWRQRGFNTHSTMCCPRGVVELTRCLSHPGHKHTFLEREQQWGTVSFFGRNSCLRASTPYHRACDISRKKMQNFAGFSGANSRKNRLISRDFRGKKNQNSRNNQPISGDFRARKVKIRRKIGPFRGILAEKSQFSKDFQGQIIS